VTEEKLPTRYYAVFMTLKYSSIAEAQAKAPDDLATHIARSRQLHQEGKVLMAGAFLDRPEEPVGTMVVCSSRESAEEFAQGDPFVIKGMVSQWTIREWANMFA
jgi:uncharacterized protein YciI